MAIIGSMAIYKMTTESACINIEMIRLWLLCINTDGTVTKVLEQLIPDYS